MAKIKTAALTQEFKHLAAQARGMNEWNDCTVKAVALACNVSYDVAHRAMEEQGRERGRPAFGTLEAIKKLGFKTEEQYDWTFIDKYPKGHREVLRNVTTHHPERFNKVWADGNTYVMFTKGHVLTVINGVNHDWTVGRAVRVTAIYKVTKEV